MHLAYYFIMKTPSKRELQQNQINHFLDIDNNNFMELYKKCIAKSYSFLVNDTTLPVYKPLCFRDNI